MSDEPRRTLNDGRAMPQLGLGVWRVPEDEAAAVVGGALDAGYRLVDTASPVLAGIAAAHGNRRGSRRTATSSTSRSTTTGWRRSAGCKTPPDAAARTRTT